VRSSLSLACSDVITPATLAAPVERLRNRVTRESDQSLGVKFAYRLLAIREGNLRLRRRVLKPLFAGVMLSA